MDIHAVDDRGREHDTGKPPGRIVSLVPSTTETLFRLGCGGRVVGATRFCVRPDEVGGLPKVGGTKDPSIDRIMALEPDIVIGNVEENCEKAFREMEACGLRVYAAYPRDVDGALQDLLRMGSVLGRRKEAEVLFERIRKTRSALRKRPFRYAYLIWRKPWMAAGRAYFISSMLSEAGGTNIFADSEKAYPEVQVEDLAEADFVLLSSEPFPFKERHRQELVEAADIHPSRILFVDGELCSWHGARMAEAFPYLDRFARELP